MIFWLEIKQKSNFLLDTLYDLAKERKRDEYADLAKRSKSNGYRCELETIAILK